MRSTLLTYSLAIAFCALPMLTSIPIMNYIYETITQKTFSVQVANNTIQLRYKNKKVVCPPNTRVFTAYFNEMPLSFPVPENTPESFAVEYTYSKQSQIPPVMQHIFPNVIITDGIPAPFIAPTHAPNKSTTKYTVKGRIPNKVHFLYPNAAVIKARSICSAIWIITFLLGIFLMPRVISPISKFIAKKLAPNESTETVNE
ncbi:MAG: hypothetical protein ABIH99_05770 [Candidatus Micrarchaeota archaeon]